MIEMMDVFVKRERVMYPWNNKQAQTVWNITGWFASQSEPSENQKRVPLSKETYTSFFRPRLI